MKSAVGGSIGFFKSDLKGINMKKGICVITAAVLIFEMASCNAFNGNLSKVRTVAKESEWWDDTVTVIEPEEISKVTTNKMTDLISHCYAPDEDSVVLGFMIYEEKGESVIAEHILRRYSYEGENLGQIKLEDETYPQEIFKSDGKYYAVISRYLEKEKREVIQGYELDFDNGTLKDPFSIESPGKEKQFASVNNIVSCDGKLVYVHNSSDLYGKGTYTVCVNDGGKVRSFIPDFGNDVKPDFISHLMLIDNKPVMFASVTENGKSKQLYCVIDINNLTMEKHEVASGIDVDTAEYVPGLGMYDCNNKIVCKIDPVGGSKAALMDLRNSYIGGLYDGEERILYASDDKVVFFAEDQAQTGGMSTTSIVLLKKSSENPNAGKKILSLANLENMTAMEWEAVSEFNRNSDKYFVEVSEKYYDALMEVWRKENWQSDRNLIISYESDAVDLLMADIREGTGPDMVIYGTGSAQLNNTGYMIDLTKRIKNEKSLNNGDYMDFILNPNGYDGKHYRLDYMYTFNGLVVSNSFIDGDTKGLTFEEYDKLINEHNNGKSVVFDGDLAFMELMLKNNDYSYSDGGKLKLDNENFRKIAGYIESIPEGMQYDNSLGESGKSIQMLYCMTGRAFMSYYGNNYKKFSIIGLPSPDGHAETITGTGIGITSCCPVQDGAWEFIMTMMSSKIQSSMRSYADPVLKSAMRSKFEQYIDINNLQISGDRGYGFHISKDSIDWYLDQVSDAVVVSDTDSKIIVIMNEEMPAYFAGQKSLDEVIKIIENRVNLMISERN